MQKVVTEAVRDSRNLPLICQLQIATRGLAMRDGVHTDAIGHMLGFTADEWMARGQTRNA